MTIKKSIDAPLIPLLFCGGGVIIFALGFTPPVTVLSSIGNWIGGLWLISCGLLFLRTSLKGKNDIWDRLVAQETINPAGQYLDVGCGNGLVMFKVAEQLQTGHVTGIDIWNSRDQSHNSQQSVNANIDGLSLQKKVEAITADMTAMPFLDNQFDGVTASFSIHNVKPAANRALALTEIARVLKPTGRLIIVDMESKDREYVSVLKEHGFKNIQVTKLGFDGWWGGPWAASYAITATR